MVRTAGDWILGCGSKKEVESVRAEILKKAKGGILSLEF
jgi:hypothetical protein